MKKWLVTILLLIVTTLTAFRAEAQTITQTFIDPCDNKVYVVIIPFGQNHPAVMKNRVDNISWKFAINPIAKNFGMKAKILYWIEKKFGWRVGEYKNYKLVK